MIKLLSRHIRAFRASIHQLSIAPLATLMTFAVIGIALALPAGFFVLLQNLQVVGHGLHDSAQASLFLKSDIQKADVDNLMKLLKNDQTIQSVRYVSPDQGLQEFKKQTGFSEVLSELKVNPLPGIIIVEPIRTMQSSFQIAQLVARLKRLPNVQSVQLDMQWLKRLHAIVHLGKRICYAIMFLFALGVLLIVGNTIRLTTQNYRDEIELIKLLGGTDQFIRRPFLYSGIIYGVIGGIFSWLLVDLIMWWLQGPVNHLANLYNTQFYLNGLSASSTLFLLFSGAILGYIGSWIAVGKHLD